MEYWRYLTYVYQENFAVALAADIYYTETYYVNLERLPIFNKGTAQSQMIVFTVSPVPPLFLYFLATFNLFQVACYPRYSVTMSRSPSSSPRTTTYLQQNDWND